VYEGKLAPSGRQVLKPSAARADYELGARGVFEDIEIYKARSMRSWNMNETASLVLKNFGQKVPIWRKWATWVLCTKSAAQGIKTCAQFLMHVAETANGTVFCIPSRRRRWASSRDSKWRYD